MPLDLPPIYLLSTHLSPDELHRLESSIPSLTYDIAEAQVVVGNISKAARAQFELRRLKLDTEPLVRGARDGGAFELAASVQVLRLAWLTDCLQQDAVLPTDDYLLYQGRKVDVGPSRKRPPSPITADTPKHARHSGGATHAHVSNARHHRPPALVHQTTSEHDAILPPMPAYLHTTYSCQRPTPVHPPNAAFIEELKSIRTLRLLRGDRIGVRAYSTSIATLAAYPHPLQRPQGWRDLDDVVEHGWASLSRAQQTGVKFYDEFKLKIPRREVESIAQVILSYARGIDAGFEMTIVGGYRRGKSESGDVDVILSHRQESQTLSFTEKLVLSLEKGGFITHTLSLWTRNSERGQMPLPWKGDVASRGAGFDTLDKAMVVWQTPGSTWEPEPPRRRVDIIISPWKTVGCALLGWSGGTTFQRDLRLYCKRERGLKFDSSGIRRRDTGEWADLEGAGGGGGASSGRGPAPDMETAEKRVFEGLGLTWRPPEERCTG